MFYRDKYIENTRCAEKKFLQKRSTKCRRKCQLLRDRKDLPMSQRFAGAVVSLSAVGYSPCLVTSFLEDAISTAQLNYTSHEPLFFFFGEALIKNLDLFVSTN